MAAATFPIMHRLRPAATLAGLVLARGLAAQQCDLRVFGIEDGLPGSTVTTLAQDSAGFLWLDTDGGLCRFDGVTFARWDTTGAPPPREVGAVRMPGMASWGLRERPQQQASTPGSGTWTATDRGVLRRHGHAEERYTVRNGLGSDLVQCVFADASGVVWIGTRNGGVARWTSDAAIRWGVRDGLPGNMVSAVARFPDGRLFLGCADGGLAVLDTNGLSIPGPTEGLLSGEVRCLAFGESTLLVGTADGLFEAPMHTGRWAFDRVPRSRQVDALLALPNGHVWVGTPRGLFDRMPGAEGVRVGQDTLPVAALALDGDSVLIGTAQGLFHAPAANSSASWTRLFPAGDEDITALARDHEGNIWAGTRTRGLLRLAPSGPARWTTAEGLSSDRVRQVLLDAYDNVWVGTARGFDMLELDVLQEQVIGITHYGTADGFPGIEALPGACLLDRDSALWFGTTRGAVRFDPRRLLEDPVPPRTRIADIALFFAHPDWSKWCDSLGADGLPVGLKVPYDQDHFTFFFSGLSLADPEKVRFRYRLQGHDADWSPITAEDRITYSGLGPGDYVFEVQARNGSGVWNDRPATFAFAITPPLWRTTGFRIAAVALVLLLLFGSLRLRDRRARLARERLERMVSERTRELADEKHRSESLLLNILPETTAAELKERGTTEARHYDECTVLFSDFQGFTTISERMEATGVVTELDRFFRAFDRLTDTYGLEKIKTIGDAYMCASGVPVPRADHAEAAVRMALDMVDAVDRLNAERAEEGKHPWPIRIGLHSGPLVAGVVGEKKFAYDIWGSTVNLASRMESNSEAGRINCSEATYRLIRDRFRCEPRGRIPVKGQGEAAMYFVTGVH